jgi:hypothetical protein
MAFPRLIGRIPAAAVHLRSDRSQSRAFDPPVEPHECLEPAGPLESPVSTEQKEES